MFKNLLAAAIVILALLPGCTQQGEGISVLRCARFHAAGPVGKKVTLSA